MLHLCMALAGMPEESLITSLNAITPARALLLLGMLEQQGLLRTVTTNVAPPILPPWLTSQPPDLPKEVCPSHADWIRDVC